MKFRFTLSALLAATAALLVAFASPALAKGGGGGGGGVTTVPTVSCAQITSAIVNPNPVPFDPKVIPASGPLVPMASLDVTVTNMCLDEGGGPRSSAAVALTAFDTATGAQLSTSVNMDPPGGRLTFRWWLTIPTADTTAPAITDVISVTRANGQVQDTVTTTAAAVNAAILAAEATGTPQSLR
jgi:hypothetical protein